MVTGKPGSWAKEVVCSEVDLWGIAPSLSLFNSQLQHQPDPDPVLLALSLAFHGRLCPMCARLALLASTARRQVSRHPAASVQQVSSSQHRSLAEEAGSGRALGTDA